MQIMIEINEDDYHFIKRQVAHGITNPLKTCVARGIPLPKGHGDLVDYEEMKNSAREYGAYTEAALSHVRPKIIIEADTEEEDADSD